MLTHMASSMSCTARAPRATSYTKPAVMTPRTPPKDLLLRFQDRVELGRRVRVEALGEEADGRREQHERAAARGDADDVRDAQHALASSRDRTAFERGFR